MDEDPRLKILVAEDNIPFAGLLSDAFTRKFHHVAEVAHDGEEALSKAIRFLPDIIFLDLGLPKIDGYAVAETLRNNPLFAKTSIIALTGFGMPEDKMRAKEAGFNRYLVKPIRLEELGEVLREISTSRV